MSDVQTPSAADGGDTRRTTRRNFLRIAGLSGAALLLPTIASGCVSEEPTDPRRVADLDFRTDAGLVNFAWVAAQATYDIYQTSRFYSPYAGITALESATIQSLAGHASSYKLLFYRIGRNRLPDAIRFEWKDIDFSSRASFYPFITELEEKLAGAYAWSLAHASDGDTLTLLGKMASVSGRHVAVIRDLADIAAGHAADAGRTGFANDAAVSLATGMQVLVSPADAMEFLRPYILTPLTVRV